MKQIEHQSLTPIQFIFFIVQTQIGVGVLSLPYSVFTAGAKSDAWISVIVAGLFVQLLILMFWLLTRRYPTLTFYEILSITFGKRIGAVFKLLYVIYFLVISSLILILFNQVVETWAYPRTPNWAIVLMLVIMTYYLTIEKLRIISRFYVLVSIFLLAILFLTLPAYQHIDIRYLMPIGHSGIANILLSGKEALFSLLGFEFLIFLLPFVKGNNKQKLYYASIANVLVTVYYSYITFLTLTFFSPVEITLIPQPVLYLINAFTFTIVERVDIIFLSIWFISVFTSYCSYVYFSALGLANTFSLKKHKFLVPIILVLSAAISLIPRNVLAVGQWSDYIGNIAMVFAITFPLLFLFIASVFKKGRHL